MLLTMMMYQCCIIALMITRSIPTQQSSASPSSADLYPLPSTMHADDRTSVQQQQKQQEQANNDRLLVKNDDHKSGDVSLSGALDVVGNSGQERKEYKTNKASSVASSRNALDDTAKDDSMKHRTLQGGPMSPSHRDSDNPWHTTDSEMSANPSTTQRSLTATGQDESGNTGRMMSRASTVPSSVGNGGGNISLSLVGSTMLLLPSSVPAMPGSQPQLPQLPQQQQQRHRTINSMNLNPTTPAMVVKPVNEHRKLLKSTGPILNYVFDSHPPYYKSTYYNTRYGPHFETDNVTNITVQNGDDLFLSCRISLLQDKTVSWVRRKHGETDLQLLTVGKQTYSGDPRYTIEFQYPNNWRLKIAAASKSDEGVYECQISTHPPKVIIYYLHVNAPEILIVDEEGEPLYDKYYEVGSTIKLMCRVRHMSMLRSAVYWIHNDNILNHDVQRGGISVKTNLTNIGANSTLFVAKVNKQDSGSYTCSIGPNQHYSVSVHVLNGTANPYGIYQRSCAFSALLEAVDVKFILQQLLLLLVAKHLLDR
ncbi:uncharacterized protein LOC129724286 [Wyeomyia smithii]|uniref:uncharacterized protein LOC129724286 n=1 Tax=Wyeomyia smithii TaxID=174621 RepID=UPI00246804DF|nr:uncharacterized protein LOC129724286 [Wyeomyia smithii]XP_055535003.1 uncharacterized protein LOC129724286 [Wyeomyia smithii]